ncbi:MAG: hypothetical protein AB7S26_10825 [Sandaracinaceae bacterium]
MPLPPLLILAVVSGIAAAVAGRHELRQSPRPIFLTRTFSSFVGFALLVLVPISAYFYVFHGDWFLLYLFDVTRIPSALALIGFLLEAVLGALGFLGGAILVRNQRETIALGVIGAFVVGGAVSVFFYYDRLAQVGTFAQFHGQSGQFGLEPFENGSLITGGLVMGAIALLGLAALLGRLWMAGRAR